MWAAFRALFAAIRTDRAALLLIGVSPVLYAFFYPSAYTGEVAIQVPVVVVDQDRSALSRALIVRIDAVQQVRRVAELADPAEARVWLADGRALAAVTIPADFSRRVANGGTGQVILQGHGAYLLRTSTALAGVAVALGDLAREAAREQARAAGAPAPPALTLVSRPLFNTREGYGAAVFPAVAFVIVHQTLILGLALLAATAREQLGAPLRFAPSQLAGFALASMVIGLLDVGWFAGFVFWLHDYPRAAAALPDLFGGAVLFVAATVAAALAVGSLFRVRERPLQLGLATSLPLFFLSGATWPLEATPAPLVMLSRLFPTTAGLELMVGLNQFGARLADHPLACLNLLLLALVYGGIALVRTRAVERGP